MIAQLKRFYLIIVSWLAKPEQMSEAEVIAEIEAAEVPAPEPEPAPAAPQPDDPWAKDALGEFYFREAILDQLDHYMLLLERMRRADPQAYSLYRQTGAHVVPKKTLIPLDHAQPLEPWFRQTLPAFGAVFTGDLNLNRKLVKEKGVTPAF